MKFSDWAVVSGAGLEGFREIVYEKRRHLALGGGVARISLNKPTQMNTLTLATVDEMFRAFYDANHDPLIGVIVVAARGKHFGAGGNGRIEVEHDRICGVTDDDVVASLSAQLEQFVLDAQPETIA